MADQHIFADIHVHPLLKYLLQNRKDIWNSIGTPNKFSNKLGFQRFSTADFRRMSKAGVQIVFAVLHPPEQKTLFTNVDGSSLEDRINHFTSFITRIPEDELASFRKVEYDHYDKLKEELALFTDNEKTFENVMIAAGKVKCSYRLASNFGDVEKVLEKNVKNEKQHRIAVVLTIEGLHALGTGHVEFNGQPNPLNVAEEELLRRIDLTKGISSSGEAGWEHSPIWITPAHAFNNHLLGHAQALFLVYQLLFQYAEPYGPSNGPKFYEGLNEGMRPLGEKCIKRMLGIDAISRSRKNPGRRIFVDIKHMSTKSRQDYYDLLDTHRSSYPNDNIPIVMSHAAVNGKPFVKENNFKPGDTQEEYENADGFCPWSINLYDDEIVRIHNSVGLIGIIAYEPILGGKKRMKGKKDWDETEWAELIAEQIEHIVKTVYKSGAPNPEKVWDIICLGTDFDGQNNPTDAFFHSKNLEDLKVVLPRILAGSQFLKYRYNYNVVELVEKFCYKNVVEFLRRNWST